MIYKFAADAPVFITHKIDAQAAGERLATIAAAKRGTVVLDDAVEDAVDPSSPLHAVCEWDDYKAAHQHRRHQIGNLIRTIVTIEHTERGLEEVRAFISVVHERLQEDFEDGGYVPRVTVVEKYPERYQYSTGQLPEGEQSKAPMRSLTFTERVIDPAWDALIAWLERYGQYRDEPEFDEYFGPVVQAIEGLPLAKEQVTAGAR